MDAPKEVTNEFDETRKKKDERMWAVLCHLAGLLGFVLPLANIAAPFIIWSIYRDQYPFVADQGKEALNFQISLTIYVIASAILVLVAIGLLFLIVLGIFALVVMVLAALNASEGTAYRYPLTIRFII